MESVPPSLEALQEQESSLRGEVLHMANALVESFGAYLPNPSTPFVFPMPAVPDPSDVQFAERVNALQSAQTLVSYCTQLQATVHDLDQDLQALRRTAKSAAQAALGDNLLQLVAQGMNAARGKFYYAAQYHASMQAYTEDAYGPFLEGEVVLAVREALGSATIAYQGLLSRFRSATVLCLTESLKAFGWPPPADGKATKGCFEPISQLHGQALGLLGSILCESAYSQATHAAATSEEPLAALNRLSTGGAPALEALLKPAWGPEGDRPEQASTSAPRVYVGDTDGADAPSTSPRGLGSSSSRRPWLWVSEALCSGLEERLLYHCGLKDLPGGSLGPVADAKGPTGLVTQMWLMFSYLAKCMDVLGPQLDPLEAFLGPLGLTSQGLLRWGLTRSLSRLARSMTEGYMLPTLHSFASTEDQRAVWVSLICMASDFERRIFWCGPMPLFTPNAMATLSVSHPTGSQALEVLQGLPVPPGGLDISAFPTTLGLDHLDEKNDPEGLSALFQDVGPAAHWLDAWTASTVHAIRSVLNQQRFPGHTDASLSPQGTEGAPSLMQSVADVLLDGPSLVEQLIGILRCSLAGLHGVGVGAHTRSKSMVGIVNAVSDELYAWIKHQCEAMEVHDNLVAPMFIRRAASLTRLPAELASGLRDWAYGEGLVLDYPSAADRMEALCGRLDRMRRRWSLRMSSHASRDVHTALRTFLAQAQDRYGAPEVPSHFPDPSPALDQALKFLSAAMDECYKHMDLKSFAECWRAVAHYLNRLVFNNIATEMVFTSIGAQRFAADVGSLLGAFDMIGYRASSFFQETSSASILLSLPSEEAHNLLEELDACVVLSEEQETARTSFVLHKQKEGGKSGDTTDRQRLRERVVRVLDSLGAKLTHEQALCVLCLREDIYI